jgi:hypothetical protein
MISFCLRMPHRTSYVGITYRREPIVELSKRFDNLSFLPFSPWVLSDKQRIGAALAPTTFTDSVETPGEPRHLSLSAAVAPSVLALRTAKLHQNL